MVQIPTKITQIVVGIFKNLNFGFILQRFKIFRHLFTFSPWQWERSAIACSSKSKNLLGIFSNLQENKPVGKGQVSQSLPVIAIKSILYICRHASFSHRAVPNY
jgi:hypothetical protein